MGWLGDYSETHAEDNSYMAPKVSVLALIPARAGSKGIPGKNFRYLGGKTLVQRAIECAKAADCEVVVSTDYEGFIDMQGDYLSLPRPSALAQDDTPMYDVVQHALSCILGSSEDLCVLLQPTQPLRTPEHVKAAIELLRQTGADSVVSVTPLPLTHSPDLVCEIEASGRLAGWEHEYVGRYQPTRRQDARPAYKRDGTCYAFFRRTVDTGTLYGTDCRPLIIPPDETCELDTEADWQALEARWRQTHG